MYSLWILYYQYKEIKDQYKSVNEGKRSELCVIILSGTICTGRCFTRFLQIYRVRVAGKEYDISQAINLTR